MRANLWVLMVLVPSVLHAATAARNCAESKLPRRTPLLFVPADDPRRGNITHRTGQQRLHLVRDARELTVRWLLSRRTLPRARQAPRASARALLQDAARR